MRLRIIEAALRVFAEKGPDVAVIDDFIHAAGVARGTFYNHFRTTEDLGGGLKANALAEMGLLADTGPYPLKRSYHVRPETPCVAVAFVQR